MDSGLQITNSINNILTNIQHQSKIEYIKLYKQIIHYRKQHKLIKQNDGKIESHHIIPRSLCKGKKWMNYEYNIINVYGYEHFICHYLLWKIYPCRATIIALWNMCNVKKMFRYDLDVLNKIDVWKKSQDYQLLRENCCLKGEKNGNYGHKWNDEQRRKMSEYRTGKSFATPQMKKQLRIRMSGQGNISSASNMSLEKRKEKRKKAQTTLNAKKTIVTCPYCSKQGTGYNDKPSPNMKRYHFDNCLCNPNVSIESINKRKATAKKISETSRSRPTSEKQLQQLAKMRNLYHKKAIKRKIIRLLCINIIASQQGL